MANPRFTQVVGSVNYQQALPFGVSAGIAWSGQWADTIMPQNQQWVLGGFGNLTAWLPAILVGDSGTLLRATVQSPPWRWKEVSVSGNAFVEAGLVNTHYTPAGKPANRAASDAGLSVSGSIQGGNQRDPGVRMAAGDAQRRDVHAQRRREGQLVLHPQPIVLSRANATAAPRVSRSGDTHFLLLSARFHRFDRLPGPGAML